MVIAIVGIMAGIAMPRYARSIARYRCDMAARRVAADLNLAQSRATGKSQSQTVTFTTSSGEYQLVGMTDLDGGAGAYIIKLGGEPYRVTMTTATFGADSSVIFDLYGIPDSAGTVTVTCGDFSKTVTLNADSGAVTIQ